MEPRRRDTRSAALSPAGSGTGRAVVIGPTCGADPRGKPAAMAGGTNAVRRPGSTRRSASPAAIDLDVVESRHRAARGRAGRRPVSARARSRRSPASSKTYEAGLVVVDGPLSPVQQRNLEKAWNAKVHRPHRADPGNLRPPRAHQGGRAAGRARPSDLPEEPAGALLDPPRAPARRLRLPRRPGRDPDRGRPPADRGADRPHRGRAGEGQAPPQAASREPRPRAVPDRGAGRLHQRRQVDAVQPPDARRACCRPTCCSRRSIRRCARCSCRAG